MNRLTVFVLLAALAAHAGVLRMTVSDVAAEPSGLAFLEETNEPGPPAGRDEYTIMPGWPVKLPYATYSPSRGVATADFDGDGRLEIVMPTGDGKVHVFRYDGSYYPGWPKSLVSDSCQYAASIGDVDLDGEYEVAVGTRSFTGGDGPVYLFDEGGNVKQGWPFRGSGGYFNESPTLVDIDGDDTLEVIVAERVYPVGYVYAVRHDGSVQPGAWPCTLDHVPATGAAAGDLDGDGTVEIVQGSYNSLYVYEADGSLRAGWPRSIANANFSYQSPALADIDGDDTLEIVTGMHKDAAGCYVFRHDGTLQPGWPKSYARWTYCPPSAADLYRDASLKIVHGVAGGMVSLDVLYAFDAMGSVLPGFPYSMTGGVECDMSVADIDGDGDMEILFTNNMITSADSLGYVFAVRHDGGAVEGFPLRPWGFTYLNGLNVADVDGDDSLDIIAVSAYAGELHITIWEAGVPFSRMSWEWPTYQFDMRRTGVYQTATTGVADRAAGTLSGRAVHVSPNPARAGQSVRLGPGGEAIERAGLYDRGGRLTAELSAREGSAVLPAHLARGVYFLRAHGRGTLTAGAKLVVE